MAEVTYCVALTSRSPLKALARRPATNWHDGQNSVLPKPQITDPTAAVPFRQEGRSRVVTNAGWDVVDATAPARHGGRRAS
jgi:hypothetical protein